MRAVRGGVIWVSAEIDGIATDLAWIIGAINRARGECGGAAELAGQIARRAAGSGYEAIAVQFDGIRKQITILAGTLGAAASAASSAGTTARAMSGRSTPDEVRGRLGEAAGQLDAMRSGLVTAIEQLGAVSDRVHGALHGGQPGPMLQRLDMIRQLVQAAGMRSTGTKTAIHAAIGNVGQIGAPGAGSGN
mgnify:FL=1